LTTTIPSSVPLRAGGSSKSNKLAESIGVNLYNAAISIIHESDKDVGYKDNSDDDSILLSSLSSGENNTFEKRKFYRTQYKRKSKESSNWWTLFLDPSIKAIYLTEPNGREANRFRRMFRIPYSVLRDQLLDLAVEKWWPSWKANKEVDCCGLPVGDLEDKLLGALFKLGTAATHFVVSMNTNLSKETHRSFFINWTEKMASLQYDFIYTMPSDDEQYSFLVNEYRDMGLPGCVGSVDCVHTGWDQCPSQYFHMYTGKRGFSIHCI